MRSPNKNYVETMKKLDSFSNLKVGWNFGDGDPISKTVIENCKIVLEKSLEIDNLEVTNAFPGNGGEISLVFYRPKNLAFDCIAERDGTYSLNVERYSGKGKPGKFIYDDEELSLEQVLVKLKEFSEME